MHYFQDYFGKKEEIPINPKFKGMSNDELLITLKTIKDANDDMKNTMNILTEENKELKNTILNKPEKSSEFQNIYKDIKYTFFSSNESDIKENLKDLNDFLYDQYLLYDGLEEDEINDLNQLQIKEDKWSDNQDFFNFKQKIIERNYQELFRNMTSSSELQNLYGFKSDDKIEEHDNNNKINEINNNENIQENKDITNNNEIKNNTIKENNEKENKENNKEIKLETVSDKINSEEKKKKKKKKEKEKEKEKEKKSSNSITYDIGSLNPINDLKKKSSEKYDLDNLLDDENNDDNEISFKNLTNDNKNKGWGEE